MKKISLRAFYNFFGKILLAMELHLIKKTFLPQKIDCGWAVGGAISAISGALGGAVAVC